MLRLPIRRNLAPEDNYLLWKPSLKGNHNPFLLLRPNSAENLVISLREDANVNTVRNLLGLELAGGKLTSIDTILPMEIIPCLLYRIFLQTEQFVVLAG